MNGRHRSQQTLTEDQLVIATEIKETILRDGTATVAGEDGNSDYRIERRDLSHGRQPEYRLFAVDAPDVYDTWRNLDDAIAAAIGFAKD